MNTFNTSLRYWVVIHDFHGYWTNHPLRTVRAFYLAWLEVAGEHPSKELTLQILNRPPDLTLRQVVRDLIRERGFGKDEEVLMDRLFNEHLGTIYIQNYLLTPTIRRLSELGVIQILLTNSRLLRVEEVVSQWGLRSFMSGLFGVENTPETVDDRPKPGVRIARDILQPLGIDVPNDRVLMVGDHYHDVLTAKAPWNQVDVALLVTGSSQTYWNKLRELSVFPDHIILQPMEVVEIVLGGDIGFEERHRGMLGVGLTSETTTIFGKRGRGE